MTSGERLLGAATARGLVGRGPRRLDPFLAFNFLVELEGIVVGGFSEVTGLQFEIEVEDYREGGQNAYVHRLPGPARYPANLVLKRGLSDRDALWRWHQAVMAGRIERRNVSIVLLETAREEVFRWNFVKAYPLRWVGPDLNAASATLAVETLELAHRGLEPLTSGPPSVAERVAGKLATQAGRLLP